MTAAQPAWEPIPINTMTHPAVHSVAMIAQTANRVVLVIIRLRRRRVRTVVAAAAVAAAVAAAEPGMAATSYRTLMAATVELAVRAVKAADM